MEQQLSQENGKFLLGIFPILQAHFTSCTALSAWPLDLENYGGDSIFARVESSRLQMYCEIKLDALSETTSGMPNLENTLQRHLINDKICRATVVEKSLNPSRKTDQSIWMRWKVLKAGQVSTVCDTCSLFLTYWTFFYPPLYISIYAWPSCRRF